MTYRYRCPSCYQEFENNTGNNTCTHCKVPAFQIEERGDIPDGKELDDMEPKSTG